MRWRWPLGFAACAVGGLLFAWFARADSDRVWVGLGTGILFVGLAVVATAGVAFGTPVPPLLAGPALIVSAAGSVMVWWGSRRAPTPSYAPRGRDPAYLFLFVAVVVALFGAYLIVIAIRRGSANPSRPTAGEPGTTAIDVALAESDTAVDTESEPNAEIGPAWVWLPDVLFDGPVGPGCWDWYAAGEEWPAGRESEHVAGASATLDELRRTGARLLGQEDEQVRLVLAEQTILVSDTEEAVVWAYLVR